MLLIILFDSITILLVLSLLAANSICLIVLKEKVHVVFIIIELRLLYYLSQLPRILVLALFSTVKRLMQSGGYLGRLPVASLLEGLTPGLQGVRHLINLGWGGLITAQS